jgi:hypothetical protein
MPNLSSRAREIMFACQLFGVPGNRDTAYALSELSAAVHDELDAEQVDKAEDYSDI